MTAPRRASGRTEENKRPLYADPGAIERGYYGETPQPAGPDLTLAAQGKTGAKRD